MRTATYFTSLALLASCTSSPESHPQHTSAAAVQRAVDASTTTVTVDFGTREQRISGFGTSSAWTTPTLTDEQADFFFSEERGLGISLLRLRIAPDGTTLETRTALRAQERGVRVWAAPWSPPGEWKTNGTDNHGGSLLPEYYQAWAERLAAFTREMKQQGVELIALSAQNEPNWTAEWETCNWTPAELVTFIRDHLGPALQDASPNTLLMAPESANWTGLRSYTDALLADEQAREFLGIVATHAYGGFPFDYPKIREYQKEFWETEISYSDSRGISAALATARMIHDHLSIARVNAWNYWWMNSDNETSLLKNGEVLPQAYGLGHFSKFVRPGFYKVQAEPRGPSTGIGVSAFADPDGERFAIVTFNDNDYPVTQRFAFQSLPSGSLRPWLTREGIQLEAQPVVTATNSFEYTLPASSIITFVGTDDPPDLPVGEGGAGGTGAGAGADAGGSAGQDTEPTAGASAVDPETGGSSATPNGGKTTTSSGGRAASGGSSAMGGAAGGAMSTDPTPSLGGSVSGRAPEYPVIPGCYCRAASRTQAYSGASWLLALGSVGAFRLRRRPPRNRG
ncbi:MAG TPA: glycoside hydrolase [Polyangiaceae bacterium]|nr:glycoside hydrolase [Polyangiaceae bacterium]